MKSPLSSFAKLTAAVGVAAPILLLVAALGTRARLWSWSVGHDLLAIGVVPVLALVGLVLGLCVLGLCALRDRKAVIWPLVAVLASGVTLAGFWWTRTQAAAHPPVHEVSTDWSDPIGLSRDLREARTGAANAWEDDPKVPASAPSPWGGRRVAEINRETCPGARVVPTQSAPETAAAALESVGADVVGTAAFRAEGTKAGLLFGEIDDIVIRIRPGQTDVRSGSRLGQADAGRNCARVTKIVAFLERAREQGR